MLKPAVIKRPLPLRLALGFVAFVMATLLVGTLVQRQVKSWSERAATEALRAAVNLGAHGMNLWLSERFADAEAFANNASLHHVLLHVMDARGGAGAERVSVQASLDSIRHRYGYKAVSLIDTTTHLPLFVSGEVPTRQDMERAASASAMGRAVWVDLAPLRSSTEYRAGVVRRFDTSQPLANLVLLLEVDPLQLVQSLSNSAFAAFDGQSFLMRVQGSSVLRFAPTQRANGGYLSSFGDVPVTSVEHRLVTMTPDVVQGASLNGRQAVAMRQELTLPGWYLVGVLDESEVFSELQTSTPVAVAAYGLLVFLVALGMLWWVRKERVRQNQREAEMAGFYDKILRNGDALFILNDWRGKVIDASLSALQAFALPRNALLGLDVMELAPANERAAILETVRGMQPGDSRTFSGERKRRDGTTFFVEGSVGLLEIQGRRYFHSVARDVTQARAVQARLQQAASVFELAPAAIVICDANFVVVSVNPAFSHITGYAKADIVGVPVVQLTTAAQPERTADLLAHMRKHDHWEGEMMGRRRNGELYPRHILAAAHRDANGTVYQYIGMFTDLSMLQQARTEAQFHANHDPLTALPNRRGLDTLLPALIEDGREKGKSLTVAVFNLDRFKAINESFGIAEGDKVLREIANRLQAALPLGRLFRFGGDEIVALLDGSPVGHALTIDKTLSLVCAKLGVGAHWLVPSVSVGVAGYPELGHEPDSLLRNAGSALTIAKARGGSTWQLYEPAMNASAHDDMLLAVDLRAAMDERQLELYFQPQARIASQSLVGLEALLRWNHPTRGRVPPSRFIPIAEASGLIMELSRWVMNEACRVWGLWRTEGLMPPSVAVNVSALQFSHPDFLSEVQGTIERHDVAPHSLVLELTESLIMDKTESAIGTMHSLVAMGVRIALDDFGTGYSSLSYLTRLPLDKLKVDRSFIQPIGSPTGREGEAIVKSVISMAKALNLRVVAEGVETQAQANFLHEHGCEEMQGYLFAKPMAAAELRQLLASTLPMRRKYPPSGYQPAAQLQSA